MIECETSQKFYQRAGKLRGATSYKYKPVPELDEWLRSFKIKSEFGIHTHRYNNDAISLSFRILDSAMNFRMAWLERCEITESVFEQMKKLEKQKAET